MKASTIVSIPLLALLVGCPVGPKSEEETDDGADSSPPATGTTGPSGTTDPGASPRDPEGQTCEEELEQVKKALAECEAKT